jgi:hypothetical protein
MERGGDRHPLPPHPLVYRLRLERRKEQDGVGQFGKGRGARHVWQGSNSDQKGSNRID